LIYLSKKKKERSHFISFHRDELAN